MDENLKQRLVAMTDTPTQMATVDEAYRESNRMLETLTAYRDAFRNLMAVIDGDGGHKQVETGDVAADGARGEAVVVALRVKVESLTAEVARLVAEIEETARACAECDEYRSTH